MKNDFTAICMLVFTAFVVIACFWCLTPVFSSIGTAWTFLCQFISFQILLSVLNDIYKYIKKQLDNKDK